MVLLKDDTKLDVENDGIRSVFTTVRDDKDNKGKREYGFNGVSTVTKKVKESQKLGLAGVMFWQIAGDLKVGHEKSLLKAMSQEF